MTEDGIIELEANVKKLERRALISALVNTATWVMIIASVVINIVTLGAL